MAGHIKDVELNVLSAACSNLANSLPQHDNAIANVHWCVYTIAVYIDSVGLSIAYLWRNGNARARTSGISDELVTRASFLCL